MNAISTCNQIYYTIENSEADIDNREQVLAEIRGVRAFWYYAAINNYGNVPIVTDFTDTSMPSTSSRADVYAFALSELNAVKDLVRDDVSSSGYGKITKGVIYTLLAKMYLNALVRMGTGNDEATRLVNVIRTRAFDDASKLKTAVTLDDIYEERRFELAWEGYGRQDQIRFGTFGNAIPGWKNASDANHELFPIPQTAINANPNLTQNPGY